MAEKKNKNQTLMKNLQVQQVFWNTLKLLW
jgi:hypothetical protein